MGKKEKLLKVQDLENKNCCAELDIMDVDISVKSLGIFGTKNSGVTNCTRVWINKLVTEYSKETLALSVIDCHAELLEGCNLNNLVVNENNCNSKDLIKHIDQFEEKIISQNEEVYNIMLIHDLAELLNKVTVGTKHIILKRIAKLLETVKEQNNVMVILASNDFYDKEVIDNLDTIFVFRCVPSLSNMLLGSTRASKIKSGMFFRITSVLVLDEKEKVPLIDRVTLQNNLSLI